MAVDYTQRSVTGSNADGLSRANDPWSLFTPRTFTTTGSFLPQSPDQSATALVGLAAQSGVVGSADLRS